MMGSSICQPIQAPSAANSLKSPYPMPSLPVMQLEDPVHAPQAQVAARRRRRCCRAGDRRGALGPHRVPEADEQAEPQQRVGELVGQELRVEVDHRQRDEEPGEQRARRAPVPPKPKRQATKPDSDAGASSTSGYRALIGALQLAHLRPSASQLTTGMFCSAVIGALQSGQAERGTMRLNVGAARRAASGSAERRAFGAQARCPS